MKELTLIEQHILLATHQLKDEAYLISIRDFIHSITGKELAIGTIYVPLERLHRMGFLSTKLIKPSPRVGGRAIKYYSLTQGGIRTLSEMKRIQEKFWWGFAGVSERD